jgi:DNA-binding MarR family transcriptional regulator
MFVLSAVSATPGCSINDVALATMTDRSSVANIVDRLVETGYLTRAASGEDRRRASIALTTRGTSAVKTAASPAPTALLIAGLVKMSATQRQALARGLVELTREMGIADRPPAMLFEDTRHTPNSRGKRR